MNAESNSDEQRPLFAVVVLDMFHYDPDEDTTVCGFATLELAREYARRRTRDSLEEQRAAATSAEDLRRRWVSLGEDCIVPGDTFRGANELDFFIARPATAEERDWVSLTPDPELRRALQQARALTREPMKRATEQDLVRVLRRVKALLAREGNDFGWSSFANATAAHAEIDELFAKLKAGDSSALSGLGALFAPTGPIQEVSASSGWGDGYLEIAADFEALEQRISNEAETGHGQAQ